LPRLIGLALAAAWVAISAAPAAAGPYLLLDADSGKVISQSKAGQPWYPASVTKLMTTYLTFRAMRAGKIKPDTLVTFSENALAQAPSKMGFPLGSQITVDNAIKMLMVKSANDVAVVLAEGVSGDLPGFIEEMNRTASRLGMSGTHFANPNGLPDETQFTTARDMAILARAIIQEFPEYELYFRIPALRIGKRLLRNHNKLIDHYPGADGMKTGFICASGFNMVATAKRDGKRLIAVVFGAYSSHQRNQEAARLFEKGFGSKISIAAIFGREPTMLDSIQNIAGTPTDLHEQMCNRKRKRPAAESDIDEEEPEEAGSSGALAKAAALVKKPLLVDLPPSMPPIKVFIGPAPKMPEVKMAAAPKSAKSKTAKTAAVGATAPAPRDGEKSNSATATATAGAVAPTTQASASGGPYVAEAPSAFDPPAAANKMPVQVPLPRPRPKK
jgi:D-alanyl-D-alanine carboxypeptidase